MKNKSQKQLSLFYGLGDDGFKMFDGDFYPTPNEVIERMLEVSDVSNKVILEPSAGRGNIVDYLNKAGAKEVLVCEKQPDLQAILQSKKCRFLSDDFLKVNAVEVSHIDMIVMNPPFSKQYDHILHAWDIAPDNCEIITLCNGESWDYHSEVQDEELEEYEQLWKNDAKNNTDTRNHSRYKKRGMIDKLIEKYGSFNDFGRCFHDAERKTDVKIACIRLYKPASEKSKEFENYFSLDEDFEPENYEAGIVTYDFVKDAVNSYVAACKMFDSVMKSNEDINRLTRHFGDYPPIVFGAKTKDHYSSFSETISYDTFKKELQKQAWKWLFDKFDMQQYVTQSVMSDINKFVEKQTQVPFTVKNIYLMIQMIVGTHSERMERVLVECFDHICSFSADNKKEGGYKMNSGYKITERFKVPGIIHHEYGRLTAWEPYDSYQAAKFDDCLKALCYFNGIKYEDNKHSLKAFFRSGSEEEQRKKSHNSNTWFDFPPFFEIKYFQNGNADFKWKDPKFLERFNKKVAEIKGWALPSQSDSTKKERRNEQARQTRADNKYLARITALRNALELLIKRNVSKKFALKQ